LTLAAGVSAGRVPRPQLVVWPENASDVDPYRDATARAEIASAVRAVGAPVLVGAILQGPGPHHRRNVGILWSPASGPGARYVKRHPVPFAEYMPLRALADRVSSAAKLVTQDMVSGSGNGLLRGGPVPLGDVICFEVAYDGLVRSSVSAGARLFVVQTNNATFGHTSETYQQLAMSRLRAIETGRTVLQASTTGVSAVISPTGSVLRSSNRLFRPALLSASVPVRSGLTPAVRVGAVPEIVLSASALIGVAWTLRGARPRRRSRRHPRAAPAVEPVGVR
jgi:apolipoprotein N-acyltransferase